jgi:hypothetical protein
MFIYVQYVYNAVISCLTSMYECAYLSFLFETLRSRVKYKPVGMFNIVFLAFFLISYWAQDISTRYLAVELLMISNTSVSCHCIALDLTQDRVLSLPGFGVNIFKKERKKSLSNASHVSLTSSF